MEKTVTIEEVIQQTVYLLNRVNVPVELTEQIAVPVSHAVSNLNECLNAFRRDARKAPTADDISVQVEELGPEDPDK